MENDSYHSSDSSIPLKRLAIIWTNFGPYHMARIRALTNYFDVQAIELADYQRLYRWEKEDDEVPVITLKKGASEDQGQLGVALELWRQLSKLRPTVVLVPGYATLPAICAALWGRAHGASTFLMSESNFDDHPRHSFSEVVKRVLVTLLFNGGIVGGKRAASYLQRLGMPAKRIGWAYDVVDNEYFSSRAAQCRRELDHSGNGSQPLYFLFVGRLAPEKNVSTLLDAFGKYRDSGGAWHLVIAGDGPLNKALRAQADALIRSGKVVFTGHKSVNGLPSLYAFAGCFVLPSLREPWGLVVNEAMASGLPVIVSSRCGCSDDLVENEANGFIIDPSNVFDLTAALERMARLSEKERAKMAKKSQTIIAGYSTERWASEVARIVNTLHNEGSTNEI